MMKKESNEYLKKIRLDTTPERLVKAMLDTPPHQFSSKKPTEKKLRKS